MAEYHVGCGGHFGIYAVRLNKSKTEWVEEKIQTETDEPLCCSLYMIQEFIWLVGGF